MLRKTKKNYIKYIAICLAVLQMFTLIPASVYAAEGELTSITSEEVDVVETEKIISDDLNLISETIEVTETQESFVDESEVKEYQELTESAIEIKDKSEIKKETAFESTDAPEKETIIGSNVKRETSLFNTGGDINDPFVGAIYTGRAYMVYDGTPDSAYTGLGGYVVCTSGPFAGMSISMDTCLSGSNFAAPQTGQEGTYTITVVSVDTVTNVATIYGMWENDFYYSGYQDVGGYSTYTFTPVPKNGNIELQKSSANPEITNGNAMYSLEGAVYEVFNSEGTSIGTIITDVNGYGISTDIPAGNFTVKEITAPKGYALDDTSYNISITPSQTTNLSVSDAPLTDPITILLNKIDSLTNLGLVNAEFTIKYYDVQSETDPALSGYSSTRTWVFKTNQNGSVRFDTSCFISGDSFYYNTAGKISIPFGTITIQETKAPSGYKINDEVFVRVIKEGATQGAVITYNAPTIPNTAYQAKATVTKTDSLTGGSLAGATFKIQEWNGSSYADSSYAITWNSSTKTYESDTLYYTQTNKGKYQIVEVTNPYGYVGKWSQEFTITQNNQSFSFTASNEQVRAEVKLNKTDRESNLATAQGDATLEGAVYEIYFNETVTHPDGTVYIKGDLAGTKTTDTNGELTFTDLLPYKYYVVEKTPSNGYLLDETIYYVDCTHDGIETSISKSVTVTEQIKKQAFELIKISSNGESGETELLEKAGFKVYLISDLTGVVNGTLTPSNGNDYTTEDFAAYDFSNENTAIDYSSGSAVNIVEMFTDSKGYLVSPELAYGRYVVVETTTPENHETIKPFLVTITEDSRTPQTWRIFNDAPFEFYLKIVKKDVVSGEVVLKAGASYLIKNVDTGEYVTQKVTYPKTITYGTEQNPYTTTDEGYLITPKMLKSGNYEIIEVAAPEGYIIASESIFITVDSASALQIDEESGEAVFVVNQFDDFTKVEISKKDITTEEELPGATLQIKDKEGSIVEEWVSGEKPHYIEKLPVGDYILTEIITPDGYVTAVDVEFTVEDKAEIQPVVMHDDVTKVEISKKDITTKEELLGAHLQIVDKNGKVIEEWVSGKEAHYIEKLPVGKYTLIETSAPDGYEIAENVEFEVLDSGEILHVVMYDSPIKEIPKIQGVPKTQVPKTGDVNFNTVILYVIIAVLALGTFAVLSYKKSKKK